MKIRMIMRSMAVLLCIAAAVSLHYKFEILTETEKSLRPKETVILENFQRTSCNDVKFLLQGKGEFSVTAGDEWNLTSGDTVQILFYKGDYFLYTENDVYSMKDLVVNSSREKHRSSKEKKQ